jgi:hypothetical protein
MAPFTQSTLGCLLIQQHRRRHAIHATLPHAKWAATAHAKLAIAAMRLS